MKYDYRQYCDKKDCPIKTGSFGKAVLIQSTFSSDADVIEIAIPCILCEHAKKVDFSKILKKITTKESLR